MSRAGYFREYRQRRKDPDYVVREKLERLTVGERLRRRWAEATPEQRQAWQTKRWETFRHHHPYRVALIEATRAALAAGEQVAEPCDDCGGKAKAVYDWEAGTVVGWRCYPCRQRRRGPSDVSSEAADTQPGLPADEDFWR